MKKLALIATCFTLFYACKEVTSKVTSLDNTITKEVIKTSPKDEIFDCSTFFKKGDYSSICFIDSKRPKYNNSSCIFSFETKGNKQEQSIKIQFIDKKKSYLAEMHFNLNKSNYKKGNIINVKNVGDAAFIDAYGTDLKSLSRSNKDLHVQYKNMVFVIMAEYRSNTQTPCFFKDENLIAFAKQIINNL